MKVNELREKYIRFFKEHDHAHISGASLIPQNDPTVLFTTAGMHPLVPYIFGQPHPQGERLVDYQKCIRTGDIDEVGDSSHLTFFEMLGNWSLGDYFKEKSLTMSYEFLTKPEWLGIDPARISVTVFEGEGDIPRDDEAADIWRGLGISEERIYFLSRKHNWWGPAGETGPCGPDSEIFYDTGIEACNDKCSPECSCGKYLEIWNNVFMQYHKDAEGNYTPLERTCVDTGMGLERTAAILQGKTSVYETEVFQPIFRTLEAHGAPEYSSENTSAMNSMRIINDHLRTSVMIIGDGVAPSNIGQGYVLRRVIRRAIRHALKLELTEGWMLAVARTVIETLGPFYPELIKDEERILDELVKEDEKFSKTLSSGENEFAKMLPRLEKSEQKIIPGRLAFKLYDTYGFPLELTLELAKEHNLKVDVEGFQEAFKKHQEKSRASASETKMRGGLADHSLECTQLHTATHLLQQALRTVLGTHVQQKGSHITAERLRFDFTHPEAMTAEQKKQVEDLVNEQIMRGLPVHFETLTAGEAKERGALAFFEQRYDEMVKIYVMGDFSIEVCGGPHVQNTSMLGVFKLKKEQSSSAGVRRIKAVLLPREGAMEFAST